MEYSRWQVKPGSKRKHFYEVISGQLFKTSLAVKSLTLSETPIICCDFFSQFKYIFISLSTFNWNFILFFLKRSYQIEYASDQELPRSHFPNIIWSRNLGLKNYFYEQKVFLPRSNDFKTLPASNKENSLDSKRNMTQKPSAFCWY